MIVGYRLAERSKAGGEVVELAVVAGDNLAQPGYRSAEPSKRRREIVELTVVARHRAGDLRQQLVDRCDIGAVGTTHAKTVAVLLRPGQALRAPRSPDLPCDRAC